MSKQPNTKTAAEPTRQTIPDRGTTPAAEPTVATKPKVKRPRRSAEQRIADLQAQLEQVRRAEALRGIEDPEVLAVVRSLQQVQGALGKVQSASARTALGNAATPLQAYLTALNINL